MSPSTPRSADHEPTTGELLSQLSEQTSTLIRSEMRLAQAEMTQKAKRAGIGAGLLGAAGVIALYGVGTLLATIIIALALLVDLWLSALIVTAVLFVVAGVVAVLGRGQVQQAVPVAPEHTVDNVKRDVATVKEARS
ncbi:phage holin family protein [uncultured Nocardioides sp.]|uniref:phage holin family protein n=1 Tax=uncultured Nocardioides sp. TaxID=198441 RepID=UPI0026284953|nr:phage holin family protein [uncultured Nocardioides sp.]